LKEEDYEVLNIFLPRHNIWDIHN